MMGTLKISCVPSGLCPSSTGPFDGGWHVQTKASKGAESDGLGVTSSTL